jgi:hypothetical protein
MAKQIGFMAKLCYVGFGAQFWGNRPKKRYWKSVMKMGKIRTVALATTFSISAGFAAHAALLDFTSLATYNGTASGTGATGTTLVGTSTVTWTLTPTPADFMTYNFPAGNGALSGEENGFNGVAKPVGTGLAFDGDGVGRLDDEFTGSKGEQLTLSFSENVRVTGVHFLDLFFGTPKGQKVPGYEAVSVFDTITNTLLASFTSDQDLTANAIGGYKFGALTYTGKSLTFVTAGARDDTSIDFALAGANVFPPGGNIGPGPDPNPVPLPAGGLLLLTGIAGLAAARRRKA